MTDRSSQSRVTEKSVGSLRDLGRSENSLVRMWKSSSERGKRWGGGAIVEGCDSDSAPVLLKFCRRCDFNPSVYDLFEVDSDMAQDVSRTAWRTYPA